jgi:Carboxypeptidase regulatory-like domain/NPCBM-associated, NEW3 domain of alpha-galactosidase
MENGESVSGGVLYMRKLVMYVWLIILFSSAAVYAAEVTVSIDNSSATYSSSGADNVSLSNWSIWVKSTGFTSISDENIITNDTDASGNASFTLENGSYFVGAVYFNKAGDFWAPLYVGVSANAAGDGLNILNVPASTTAEINNFNKSGAVRGYVIDTSGNGINDAEVTVVDFDITLPITTRTFDSNGKDGYYSIFLSPGTYTLEISKGGYVTDTFNVTVTQGMGADESEFEGNASLSKTTPPPSDTGGGSCNHQLEISDIKPPTDAAPGADVQFQVVIDNVGTCAETGVKTTVTGLPGGWTAGDVTTGVGYGETVSVDIPVSIPEDAATGTVTLTFKVDPQDFIGTLEKQISFNVGEVQAEEGGTAPVEEVTETVAPPETEAPTTTAPPVETQGPEQEPVKAPEDEGKEKGGICGPTAILLISVLSLLAVRRRR